MGRQVLASALASIGTTIVIGGLGLVTTPYFLNRLGTDGYGVLITISLVSSHLAVSEFGFGAATTRQLALADARRSANELQQILSTSLAVFLLVGLFAGLAQALATPFLVTDIFRIPGPLTSAARIGFLLGAALLTVTLWTSFFHAVLQGLGHLGLLNLSRLVFGVLWAASAVGVLLLGHGLVAVVLAQLCVAALNCASVAIVGARLLGGLPRPAIDLKLLRSMARFGGFVFAGSVAYQWMINGPPAALATLVNSADLATFMIPHLALQKLALVVAAAGIAFFPVATVTLATDDRQRLGALLKSHVRLSFGAVAFISGYLAILARPLLRAWISPSFADQAAAVVPPLVLSVVVLALAGPFADVARATGHPSWVLLYTAGVALLGVTATFALAHWGIAIVGWGVFVAFLAPSIAFTLIVGRRLGGLTGLGLLRALRGPGIAALSAAAVSWVVLKLDLSGPSLLLVGMVEGLTYCAVVFCWVMDEAERRAIRGLLDGRAWRGRSRAMPVRSEAAAGQPKGEADRDALDD